MAETRFPEPQPGGSLLVAWQVRNKPVLVIGGGDVAASRTLSLLSASADVTLLCPLSNCNPEILYRIHTRQITTHLDRPFTTASDLDHDPPYAIVCAAIDDPLTSSLIYQSCRSRRLPVNVADVPGECDFFFGSIHRDGPLQVMVSTNGYGPKMAGLVRKRIADSLPPRLGEAIGKVGVLRKRLRGIVPEQEESGKRMKWMSQVCVRWSLEDLCEMEEADMDILLRAYGSGTVPSLAQIRGKEDEDGAWRFDGSYGWACVI